MYLNTTDEDVFTQLITTWWQLQDLLSVFGLHRTRKDQKQGHVTRNWGKVQSGVPPPPPPPQQSQLEQVQLGQKGVL